MMQRQMQRTAVIAADDDSLDPQDLLAWAAVTARARGMKVAGVLAEHHGLPDRSCAAGTLRDIASGRRHTIYLPSPPSGTSCHLDPVGVESACADVLALLPEADLVILSKFGKLEASGAGLFGAFGTAIAASRPLLTSVSARHCDAFRTHAPEAVFLPADRAGVARWLDAIRTSP